MANLMPKTVTIRPNGSYVEVEMEGHDIDELIKELEDMGWSAADAADHFDHTDLLDFIDSQHIADNFETHICDKDWMLNHVMDYLDQDDLANLLLGNEVA